MQCIATLTVFNQHLHNNFPYVVQYIHISNAVLSLESSAYYLTERLII